MLAYSYVESTTVNLTNRARSILSHCETDSLVNCPYRGGVIDLFVRSIYNSTIFPQHSEEETFKNRLFVAVTILSWKPEIVARRTLEEFWIIARSPKMNRKEVCIAVTNELALYQDPCRLGVWEDMLHLVLTSPGSEEDDDAETLVGTKNCGSLGYLLKLLQRNRYSLY
ncbi:hypothetical protein Y032_0019g3785 [Ancylostoma ceylanicum]|uniref:Uncharacterized protein n=1 Tax=Ancylostoma ceylanicum TaxID=53326 RepID=A0A016V3R3_9BILA|nr:hypothetical protein Y032_0019g3785 [Ancylostoma ceylanicum]